MTFSSMTTFAEKSEVEEVAQSALPIALHQSNLCAREKIINLLGFLKASPIAYHAGATARHLCLEHGFVVLKENKAWDLERTWLAFL